MLAVSNTSPLSNLAFIHRLELLKSQVSELWIPTAVAEELRAHPDLSARAAILFIDELEGRSLAEQSGLAITGTLGVLLRANRTGHIAAVKPEIHPLRANPILSVRIARSERTGSRGGGPP